MLIDKIVEFLAKQVKKLFGGGKKGEKTVEEAGGDPRKAQKVKAGLADIHKEEKKYLDAGKITHEEAEKVARAVKARHPVFKSIRVVDGGDSWDYKYKASPEQTEEGSEREEGNFPLKEEEKAIIKRIKGGEKVIDEITKLVEGKSNKLGQKVAEVRIALDAIAKGEKVIELSKDIPKVNGKGILTEIDVLTENEIIEVKTSEKYNSQDKLSGDDMTQFARLLQLAKGTIKPIDEKGNEIKLPGKLVYHFTAESISENLRKWLTDRSVIVRTGPR